MISQSSNQKFIHKTPEVCGRDACVGDTRIPVWLLVSLKLQGASETELLRNYPGLSQDLLSAAWEYYRLNAQEIDEAIRKNDNDED